MPKDDIYQHQHDNVPPFAFDAKVASVFDDMLLRSIPFYKEILRQQVRLIEQFYRPGSCIYDLGCSHGNLGTTLCRHMGTRDFRLIAVDSSGPMLDRYQERLSAIPGRERIRLCHQDIRDTSLDDSSVVVLNFTLQFLAMEDRERLIGRIYDGLCPGGVLLICEKITHEHAGMADLQQTVYHTFKRENGYSELEISQKREALEKVLVPETVNQHTARLAQAGFQCLEVWFKWFNFAALMAQK